MKDFVKLVLEKETADEMFEVLDFKKVNDDSKTIITYINDTHGDGDYEFIKFHSFFNEVEIGYYDGYETKTSGTTRLDSVVFVAITKKFKELGWWGWND